MINFFVDDSFFFRFDDLVENFLLATKIFTLVDRSSGLIKSTARCFDLQGGPRHAGHTMQEQEHVNVTKSSTLEQITLHVL